MAQPSAACVRRSGAAAYANRKIHERKGNGRLKRKLVLVSGALRHHCGGPTRWRGSWPGAARRTHAAS
jgi:hypothetical protein